MRIRSGQKGSSCSKEQEVIFFFFRVAEYNHTQLPFFTLSPIETYSSVGYHDLLIVNFISFIVEN